MLAHILERIGKNIKDFDDPTWGYYFPVVDWKNNIIDFVDISEPVMRKIRQHKHYKNAYYYPKFLGDDELLDKYKEWVEDFDIDEYEYEAYNHQYQISLFMDSIDYDITEKQEKLLKESSEELVYNIFNEV